MFSLKQKSALITGAASGIGAEISRVFAEAGARVFVADRDLAGAERVAMALRERGHAAKAVDLDITSEAQCDSSVDVVLSDCGRINLLVNNAGVGTVGTILKTSGVELDRLYSVNVRGMFNLTKSVLPHQIKQRSGNIINLASVGGVVGIRDRLAYCTTKFAVVGFTKSLALDHAAEGIRANCICPGRVETPFVRERLKEYSDPAAAYREMSATQLSGRMIKPEEVAASALYLAADESAMITGTAFLIDGGWTAGK